MPAAADARVTVIKVVVLNLGHYSAVNPGGDFVFDKRKLELVPGVRRERHFAAGKLGHGSQQFPVARVRHFQPIAMRRTSGPTGSSDPAEQRDISGFFDKHIGADRVIFPTDFATEGLWERVGTPFNALLLQHLPQRVALALRPFNDFKYATEIRPVS